MENIKIIITKYHNHPLFDNNLILLILKNCAQIEREITRFTNSFPRVDSKWFYVNWFTRRRIIFIDSDEVKTQKCADEIFGYFGLQFKGYPLTRGYDPNDTKNKMVCIAGTDFGGVYVRAKQQFLVQDIQGNLLWSTSKNGLVSKHLVCDIASEQNVQDRHLREFNYYRKIYRVCARITASSTTRRIATEDYEWDTDDD